MPYVNFSRCTLCTILSGDIFFTWVRYTQEMWRKQERSGRIWSDIVLGCFSKQWLITTHATIFRKKNFQQRVKLIVTDEAMQTWAFWNPQLVFVDKRIERRYNLVEFMHCLTYIYKGYIYIYIYVTLLYIFVYYCTERYC